jgi:hypothetical protein
MLDAAAVIVVLVFGVGASELVRAQCVRMGSSSHRVPRPPLAEDFNPGDGSDIGPIVANS